MPTELSREQLQRLARLGAHARLAELEEERRAILRAFPGLAAQASRLATKGRAAGKAAEAGAAAGPARQRVRRRKMSAEKRKAASERMRRFWAERRKAAEA